MLSEYYLLTINLNGVLANVFIAGTPANWAAEQMGKNNTVILNAMKISKKDYLSMKSKAAN